MQKLLLFRLLHGLPKVIVCLLYGQGSIKNLILGARKDGVVNQQKNGSLICDISNDLDEDHTLVCAFSFKMVRFCCCAPAFLKPPSTLKYRCFIKGKIVSGTADRSDLSPKNWSLQQKD
jgi:hypothetical protein